MSDTPHYPCPNCTCVVRPCNLCYTNKRGAEGLTNLFKMLDPKKYASFIDDAKAEKERRDCENAAIEQIKQENAKMKKQIAELEKKNKSRKIELRKLRPENKTLQKQNAKMTQINENMARELVVYKKGNEVLKGYHEKAKEQVKILENKLNSQTAEYKIYEKKLQKCTEKNAQLEQTVKDALKDIALKEIKQSAIQKELIEAKKMIKSIADSGTTNSGTTTPTPASVQVECLMYALKDQERKFQETMCFTVRTYSEKIQALTKRIDSNQVVSMNDIAFLKKQIDNLQIQEKKIEQGEREVIERMDKSSAVLSDLHHDIKKTKKQVVAFQKSRSPSPQVNSLPNSNLYPKLDVDSDSNAGSNSDFDFNTDNDEDNDEDYDFDEL